MWRVTIKLRLAHETVEGLVPTTIVVIEETVASAKMVADSKVREVKQAGYIVVKREDSLDEV